MENWERHVIRIVGNHAEADIKNNDCLNDQITPIKFDHELSRSRSLLFSTEDFIDQ